MKVAYLITLLIISSISSAQERVLFSEEVASGYAKIALIEWAIRSGYELDRKYLLNNPEILSGVDDEGIKIVMVLFPTDIGSYEATYTINKDGYMVKHTVGAWIYTIEEIKKEFSKSPFLPGP